MFYSFKKCVQASNQKSQFNIFKILAITQQNVEKVGCEYFLKALYHFSFTSLLDLPLCHLSPVLLVILATHPSCCIFIFSPPLSKFLTDFHLSQGTVYKVCCLKCFPAKCFFGKCLIMYVLLAASLQGLCGSVGRAWRLQRQGCEFDSHGGPV